MEQGHTVLGEHVVPPQQAILVEMFTPGGITRLLEGDGDGLAKNAKIRLVLEAKMQFGQDDETEIKVRRTVEIDVLWQVIEFIDEARSLRYASGAGKAPESLPRGPEDLAQP